MGSRIDKFVLINVGHLEGLNLEADSEYAKIKKAEKERNLRKMFPNDKEINTRAVNFHTMEMLGKIDSETNEFIYNEGVKVYESDKDGEMEFEGTPEGEEKAKKLIRILRSKLMRDTKLAKHSKEFTIPWDYEAELPVSTPKAALKKALQEGLKD